MRPSISFPIALALFGTVGCADLRDDSTDVSADESELSTATFTVSGQLTGLIGPNLILRNNDRDQVVVHHDGSFTFNGALHSGDAYAVTVFQQPTSPRITCTVVNGTGTIANANVTNVDVRCGTQPPPPPPSYHLGGTVSGLAGSGLVLHAGADDLAIASNGAFAFPSTYASGAAYSVSVSTNPSAPAQACTIANGAGTFGSADVTSVAVSCVTTTPDFYVDAAAGNDANAGTAGAPWRTISMAIRTAPTTGANIHVAPGTYSTGETFPIAPRANQHLIGDVANHGEGVVPTRISGAGNFQCSGGDLLGVVGNTTVGLEAGAEGSSIAGFSITGGSETVWICNVPASFASNTVFGSTDISVILGYRSNVTLTDNIIKDGAYGLLAVDIETHVVARGNTITTATNHAVVLGFTNLFAGVNFDFGTAASPGNNTFIGSSKGAGMYFQSATNSVVSAQGNTWRANVEGADSQGHYATQLVTSNVSLVGGTNYATRFTTGGGLQL